MSFTTWLTFFIACWAICLSPGPGAIACMSAGLNLGFRRGYFVAFGMILGTWTQLAIVAAGLGAVIAASTAAFTLLKLLGAACLVWIGLSQWRAADEPLVADRDAPIRTRRQLVLRGWGINAVNPKGTVFMLAIVPSFIDPVHPLAPQYVVIALSLSFADLVVMAIYTALAARVLRALNPPRHVRLLNRAFGSLFIVAGALLATFRRAA